MSATDPKHNNGSGRWRIGQLIMRSTTFVSAQSLIVMLFIMCESASAQEEQLRHFLRTEYLEKIDSLKRSMNNVQGRLYHRRTRSEDGLTYEGAGEFRIKGESALILQEFNKNLSPPGFPAVKVYCRNPQYVFQLEKDKPSSPFIIKNFDKPTSELRGTAAEIQLRLDLHVHAAYSACEVPLAELFHNVENKISSVSERSSAGSKFVEVIVKGGVTLEKYGYDSIRVVLEPEMGWALREYQLTSTPSRGVNKATNSGLIQYERWKPGGVVFPKQSKHIEIVEYPQKNKTYKTEREVTFSDLRWNATSDNEFTLSAYGLPEFGRAKRSYYPLDSWLFWLCVAAVVATTIGLRRYRKRAENA